MSKESCLLIIPFSPLPRNSGGRQRIWHTIKLYSHRYDLTVWDFVENETTVTVSVNKWLKSLGIKYRHFLLTNTNSRPYWFRQWHSQPLINEITKLKQNHYHKIQVEGTQLLYLGSILPKKSKKIFVSYDISTISFWRRLTSEANLIKFPIHFWRWLEVAFFEWLHVRYFDQIVVVSDHDNSWLKKYFGIKNSLVVPNGIERVDLLEPPPKSHTVRLGYIGGFAHPPNKEAVKFILEKILPEMELNAIKYELYLAGEQDLDFINKIVAENNLTIGSIHIMGFVNDVKDFYKKIDLLLAPIFSGSGTRVKILESLSHGIPVLTTTIGAEGINIKSPFLIILEPRLSHSGDFWVRNILDISKKDLIAYRKSLTTQLDGIIWDKVLSANYL